MHTKKADVLKAMAEIPELQELDLPVERLPDEAELKHSTDRLLEELQRDFEGSLGEGWGVPDLPEHDTVEAVPAPARAPCRSKHTTIRIPGPILAALYAKADEFGIGYQTLIIRTLRAAIKSW